MHVVTLIRDEFRRHGVTGSLLRAVSVTRRELGRHITLHEQHVWYMRDLSVSGSPPQWPENIELSKLSEDGVPYLSQLATVGRMEARRRLTQGAELWLAREGSQAVFACWIFRKRAPVLAARGGWLELPDGVVCLEDSVTSPAYRGRGIAPAAWNRVADELRHDGSKTIITKVASDNVPSRRAVERAGFRAVATMTFNRCGLNTRVKIDDMIERGDRIANYLIARLSR